MLKHKVAFETHAKLAKSALKSDKSTAKKLLNMVIEMKSAYFMLVESFHFYKADVIERECKTETEFNGKEENGSDSFPHNDTWSDEQMTRYIEITEALEEKIEELGKVEAIPAPENVVEEKFDYLSTEIESEKAYLKQSIDSFVDEVNSVQKIPFATAQAMEKFTEKLKLRLEMLVQRARNVDEKLRQVVNDFYNLEASKIDSALLRVCTKIEESSYSSSSGSSSNPAGTSRAVKEQVFLEKSKPPKFKGEEVDYPEFKRKWLSIVSKANLPEESEVDKLKDSIPSDAGDQLYGVTTTAKCWEILDKRFGDPRIISMKLKQQLKSIKSEGKSDPERVIGLSIKVRTIVTKLEAIKKQDALLHDSEFLSAVYYALPSVDQRKWLETKKIDCHWTAMMQFLEEAYDRATEELSLLSTYRADSDVKTRVQDIKPLSKSFAAYVTQDEGGEDVDEKREKARKRSEDFCGKCPVCSQAHTWTRADGEQWPSDRFLSCKKYHDMPVAARAKAVEKCGGCPRCTSWKHTRDRCRMNPNSCTKENSAGVNCKGDHSRLLCGSGNAYCYATKAKPLHPAEGVVKPVPGGGGGGVLGPYGNLPTSPTNLTNPTGNDAFEDVNETAETVPYFQDIEVEGHDIKARTFWDRGSTRVLIREEFGERLGLVKKKVSYTLEVVGSVERKTGYIYLLSLKDMYGGSHRIWGHGISSIMLSSVPDMSALTSTFPHVPKEAFKAMVDREVDILIGLNMTHIMPEGGAGVDKSEGVSVMRSLFAPGWVVGGVLPDVETTTKHKLSVKAAVGVAEKFRAGLKKDNLLQAYNEQVQQILDRKAAVKLSREENLDLVAKKCQVEKVHWVQSDLNPADLLTRGTASIQDIGPFSFHQKGPKFLSSPRESWPVTRSFVPVDIPEDEVRQKTFVAALKTKVYSDFFEIKLVNSVEKIARYSNDLKKVHRILSRVIRAWGFPDMEKLITMVKIMKKALHHSLPKGRELRPLAIKNVSDTNQQDEDMMPLTPNQLLLGHTTSERPSMEYSEDNRFSARLAYIQSVHAEWWRRWMEDVLPTLIPCRKWKSPTRNMKIGDVAMMVYKGNLVDDYRLVRVVQVFPDERGLIRTVKVAYRRKDRREKPEVYKSKPLAEEEVGVQRLALLQAAGEEPPSGCD